MASALFGRFSIGGPCKISLFVVAFERHNCICRSTANDQLSRARVSQLIKAFLVTLLPMFSYLGIGRDSSYTPYVLMFQIFLVIVYVVPLTFLLVTSYRIVKVVRAQASYRLALPGNNVPEKVRIEKRKQNKATRTLLILIAAFVSPYLVFVGYHTVRSIFKPSLDFRTDFMIRYGSMIVAYLNGPVNVCIHLMQLPAFREEWRKRLAYFERPLRLGVFATKGKLVVSGVKTESRPQNTRRCLCPNVRESIEHIALRRRYSN